MSVEESYFADTGNEHRVKVDPWLLLIRGRYGHIFPWSVDRIAVSVDGHTNIAGRIQRMPCVRVEQHGSFGELTASFLTEDFDTVAEIVHPYRRRQVSDAERERLARMGREQALIRSSRAPDARSAPLATSDTCSSEPAADVAPAGV